MKKPETAQGLLNHIKTMEHRERIVFNLSKQARQAIGKDSYSIEIYVTFPFEQARMSDKDPHRVLISYVTADGKTNGLARRSMKRSLVTLSLLEKLIDQMV